MSKQECWMEVAFEEICRNVSTRINDPPNSGYNEYVGLEHLDTLEPKIMRYGSTKDLKSSANLFKEGQILFGRRNWYLRRVAVADFKGVCSADIYVLEAKGEKIMCNFLPILMHSKQFFEEVMKYSAGSMSTRVKWSHLSKIKFNIPHIPTQKKIIDLIFGIDDSIAKTQSLLEKIRTYKDSKINELLTSGIKHHKFKKVKWMFDKEICIPDTWKVIRLADICTIREYYETKSELYVGLEHLSQNTNQLIERGNTKEFTSGKNIFQKNDVLYGKLRPILNKAWLATEEGYCSTDILALQTNEKIIPKILLMILTNQRFTLYAIATSAGTKMPRTRWSDMKEFSVFLPTISEQQKIASIVFDIDCKIAHTEDHLSRLKKLRGSIINERLTSPKTGDEIV